MEMMVGMRQTLTRVSFTGNKACSIYRYRDKIIAASSDALELLDQIPIQANQKVAIKGLTRHRENLKAASSVNEMDENSHGDETDHFSIQVDACLWKTIYHFTAVEVGNYFCKSI